MARKKKGQDEPMTAAEIARLAELEDIIARGMGRQPRPVAPRPVIVDRARTTSDEVAS